MLLRHEEPSLHSQHWTSHPLIMGQKRYPVWTSCSKLATDEPCLPEFQAHARFSLCEHRWEEDEVNRRLDFKMTDAFKRIWDVHQLQKLPLRTAAYVIAMRSVVQATMIRGFD